MSRYRSGMTQKQIEKRLAEGRGQGEGVEYNPWHHIQDFPSRGRVHRIKGWLHGRVDGAKFIAYVLSRAAQSEGGFS